MNNNVELFPEKLSKEELIMRIIKRGNYVPTAQIICTHCGSVLEIRCDDLISHERYMGGYDSYVECCVCDTETYVSEEIVAHLCK